MSKVLAKKILNLAKKNEHMRGSFVCPITHLLILVGKSHGKLGDHHYFLSWREPWNMFEDWDWFNGRNFCRERCMDLVSFETPLEFKMFKEVMEQGEINLIPLL